MYLETVAFELLPIYFFIANFKFLSRKKFFKIAKVKIIKLLLNFLLINLNLKFFFN